MLAVKLILFLTKQDVIDEGHIARGDLAVTVLVTVHNVAVVIVEQIIVEGSDINRSYQTIAVNVAWNYATNGCD